ncbi:MAG: inositol monophosphatase, partial [Firmicutes bacterium]|nr:inositol monophosphatase [Bacillota bacterium]
MNNLESVLQTALDTVKETYDIITNDALAGEVSVKGDADFVTQVDFKVQSFIKSRLYSEFPEIQFMGEEGERDKIDFSKLVWILDPVDGTTHLIRRYGMSAVSLALAENGNPILGIIYNPFHNELYTAVKGGGAFFNVRRIYVSETADIKDALVSIGTMPYDKSNADKSFDVYKKLFLNCIDIRRLGSAALDLAYTARGSCDAYFEPRLKPWDFAAGGVLGEEAGGTVTDFNGNAVRVDKISDIAASNKRLH